MSSTDQTLDDLIAQYGPREGRIRWRAQDVAARGTGAHRAEDGSIVVRESTHTTEEN